RAFRSPLPRFLRSLSAITRQSHVLRFSDDAAEADMAGGCVDWLGVPRRRTVAAAIVRGAQVWAPFWNLAREPDGGLTVVVARFLRPTARVLRNATGFWRVGRVLGGIPIGRPFPHVADHVVHAVAIGRERCDRRGAFVAVPREILVWEVTLPGV